MISDDDHSKSHNSNCELNSGLLTIGVKSCVRRILFGRISRCTMHPTRHSSCKYRRALAAPSAILCRCCHCNSVLLLPAMHREHCCQCYKYLYSTCQLNILNAWACEKQVQMPHSMQLFRIHLNSLSVLMYCEFLFRNPTQTKHLCKYAFTTSWAIRCKLQKFMFNFDNYSRLWLDKNELVLRGGKEVTHQKGADPEIHCKHTRRLEDGDVFPHNSRSA